MSKFTKNRSRALTGIQHPRLEEIPLKSTLAGGPGSPQPGEKSYSCRSSCNFLAGLVQPPQLSQSLTGLSGGKAASPALLHSLTSPGFHHPAGPGSEDRGERSLFQTWGAPCLHGALARLQAALPARAAAAAHRQASLPPLPAPRWLRPPR